jgi:hypothetical protein
MPTKTWAVNDVLTAADMNTYVRNQMIGTCTSGTRPSSPVEGQTIYETDTDVFSVYNGSVWLTVAQPGVWTDFSGSFLWTGTGSNPAIGNGTIATKWAQFGKMVVYRGFVQAGSSTTFGTGNWEINYPVTPVTTPGSSLGGLVGAAFVFDNSATATWAAAVISSTTSVARVLVTNAAAAGYLTPTNPMTWAVSDRFSWTFIYEAA